MANFSAKTKMRDVLKNAFGADAVSTVAIGMGLDAQKLDNPLVGAMTLGALAKLSGGLMDDNFIRIFCEKMALYENAPTVFSTPELTRSWWKEAVFYQIYPTSFCDSNGDGTGDLRGIISKLDYLKGLGVTALWLSPVYPSPMDDNGYDISNYRSIREQFGSLDDMDELLRQSHERGIKIIMDLVVNHTSDEHPWFQSAAADINSPYRDFYIWEKGVNGGPPNNWTSMFSGSAWEYSKPTDSWYLHCFSKKQPDLNWQNPKVRAEVAALVNFWYDRGVNGFRLDVINMIDKPDGFPDGSTAISKLMGVTGCEHYFFGTRAHEYLREMHAATAEGRDVYTVGETPGLDMKLSQLFTAPQRKELDTVFSFQHLYSPGTQRQTGAKYDLSHLKNNLTEWQLDYGRVCWNALFVDNHDNPRMLSRADPSGEHRVPLAKLLAAVILTLRGTPFIYQGQELGMTNSRFETIEDFRDIETLNYYKENRDKLPHDKLMQQLNGMSRDHARTPMQWDDSANAGFTTGTPWIAVNPNYTQINARDELSQENSVYNWYRRLIELRKSTPALVYGEFVPLTQKQHNLFCYKRVLDNEEYYIEINISPSEVRRHISVDGYEPLLSSYGKTAAALRPYEANIYKKRV